MIGLHGGMAVENDSPRITMKMWNEAGRSGIGNDYIQRKDETIGKCDVVCIATENVRNEMFETVTVDTSV